MWNGTLAILSSTLLIAGEAAAGGLFPSRIFEVGRLPVSVAVADLDGDGVADVVTANYESGDVSVLLGNGDGSFQPAASFATGEATNSIAVADFDGDGVPDLVTASDYTGGVSVLLGDGDGSFQAAIFFAVPNGPNFVAVGDFDGDGVSDLVTADGPEVSVLLGNGDGSFQTAVSVAAGEGPAYVTAVDLDGDGVPDLVTLSIDDGDGSVRVLLGNGDGSFQAAVSIAEGDFPSSVAVADLDGDRVPDLVTAYPYSNAVSVLLGNGDASFRPAIDFAAGDRPAFVAVADLDGDDAPDLVTTDQFAIDRTSNVVTVLLNLCGPAVRPEIDIKPGGEPNSIHLADGSLIPLAIPDSDVFDVAEVDATTLAFGPSGASLAHWRGPHFEDVNADGLVDLVAHFRAKESGIAFGDRVACLAGETLDGTPFEGCDSIRTVPDMDGDSLLDIEEEAIGTHALRFDSEGDGYGDGEEVHLMETDPLDPMPAVVRERRGGRKRTR